MKYDLQQTTKLVTQLQQAHRLAAAFYMRILPLFDTIAYQTLYSEFWFWEPTETYTPPRDTYPPSGTSAWCYLPLFASTHAYRDKTYSKAVKGDKALIFRNYIDYDFRSDSDLRIPSPILWKCLARRQWLKSICTVACRKATGKWLKKLTGPLFNLIGSKVANVLNLSSAPCIGRSPSSLLTLISLPIGSKRRVLSPSR